MTVFCEMTFHLVTTGAQTRRCAVAQTSPGAAHRRMGPLKAPSDWHARASKRKPRFCCGLAGAEAKENAEGVEHFYLSHAISIAARAVPCTLSFVKHLGN